MRHILAGIRRDVAVERHERASDCRVVPEPHPRAPRRGSRFMRHPQAGRRGRSGLRRHGPLAQAGERGALAQTRELCDRARETPESRHGRMRAARLRTSCVLRRAHRTCTPAFGGRAVFGCQPVSGWLTGRQTVSKRPGSGRRECRRETGPTRERAEHDRGPARRALAPWPLRNLAHSRARRKSGAGGPLPPGENPRVRRPCIRSHFHAEMPCRDVLP